MQEKLENTNPKGKWARLKYQGEDKTKGSTNFFNQSK